MDRFSSYFKADECWLVYVIEGILSATLLPVTLNN